ncbi:hypothetical protein J437_LFUL002779, partial [Ladona fulva]
MTENGTITRTGRRRSSINRITCESREESTVLVIYSGGTIGMQSNAEGALEPACNKLASHIRKLPFLHDEDYFRRRSGESVKRAITNEFVLPEVLGRKRRVLYTLLEYDPLLDSSNMTMDEWICLAEDIKLPIFEPRSDAKDNLLESIIIAGNYVIPEVTICFGRKLFRGNRTIKMDAIGLNAFDSPCYGPLAKLGIDIE